MSARSLSLLAAAVILLLAGCAGRPSSSFAFDEVRYQLTGGVAGYGRSLTVGPDGTCTIKWDDQGAQTATLRLPPKEFDQLAQALATVPWRDLKPDYIDVRTADAATETLRLDAPGNRRTVTVTAGADVPPELRQLLDWLWDQLNRQRA